LKHLKLFQIIANSFISKMKAINILNQRYESAKKWSDRIKTTNFYILIRKIRSLFDSISGNDVINMIYNVLNKQELTLLSKRYIDGLKGIIYSI
jgi:hypothetical protein